MSSRPSLVRSRRVKLATVGGALLVTYLVVGYVLMPLFWTGYAHRHPVWSNAPRITHTAADIPGDPLNVALVGTEADVKQAMLAAGWRPADPLTLKSCLEIAEASVLNRTYADAPVSNLFLFNRKQDLAFEQPVGDSPRKRHHVRFWKSDQPAPDGRPTWYGSATYDERVGLSHTTGQITHHIAGDIDTERDHVIESLKTAGQLTGSDTVDGFHTTLSGRNGGGDPWHTDGNLAVGTLAARLPPGTAGHVPTTGG